MTSSRRSGRDAWDTRHLSRYRVVSERGVLHLRDVEVESDGVTLSYELRVGSLALPLSVRRRLLVDGELRDRWTIANPNERAASVRLRIEAGADFRDLFEVRRARRVTRGRIHRPRPH